MSDAERCCQQKRGATVDKSAELKEIHDNAFADEQESDYEHLLALMMRVLELADKEAEEADRKANEHADTTVVLGLDGEELDSSATKVQSERFLSDDGKDGRLKRLTQEEIWEGKLGRWAELADNVLEVLLDEVRNDPAVQKAALYKLLGNYKFDEATFQELKQCAIAINGSKQMKKRYERLHQKAELTATAFGWGFFVIFLVYPSVTNRIFTTFTVSAKTFLPLAA